MNVIIAWIIDSWHPWAALIGLCVVVVLAWYVSWFAWDLRGRISSSRRESPRSNCLQLFRRARIRNEPRWALIDHGATGLVALAIGTWGLVFSIATCDASQFARSGSLITLLGLVVGFLGLNYAAGLRAPLEKIVPEEADEAHSKIDQEARNLSSWWVTPLIVGGTLIWGYGDIGAQHFMRRFCIKAANAGMAPVVAETLPITTGHCVVSGLPELLPAKSKYLSDCLDSLIARASQEEPILVLVVGRVDKRQLRSEGRRLYGSNFTLAYQRAVSMRTYLVQRYRGAAVQKKAPLTSEEFASRIAVTAGGPNHIEIKTDPSSLSDDRSVEVFSYWNTKPKL